MLQQERHHQIIAKIHLEGQVKVKDLAKEFDVTEDCIRKDLTALEKEGLIKKIHGGAMQVRQNLHFFQVNERLNVHSEEKMKIAKKAIDLIEPLPSETGIGMRPPIRMFAVFPDIVVIDGRERIRALPSLMSACRVTFTFAT